VQIRVNLWLNDVVVAPRDEEPFRLIQFRYPFFGERMEKALVFYAAALKAFSFYDHPISDSPAAPGTEPFNV